MPDRDQVIKGLQCRGKERCGYFCERTGACYYAQPAFSIDGEVIGYGCNTEKLCSEALELLEEPVDDMVKWFEEWGLTPESADQALMNYSAFLSNRTGGKLAKIGYDLQTMVSCANDYEQLNDKLDNGPVKPAYRNGHPYCGSCYRKLFRTHMYCSKCGRKVSWE